MAMGNADLLEGADERILLGAFTAALLVNSCDCRNGKMPRARA